MSSPACCTGFAHTGTPKGREETLHTLPSYVAKPSDGNPIKGIIVIVPDAFGWQAVNNRLLADRYADRMNVQCLLPEFMDGTGLDGSYLTQLDEVFDKKVSIISKIIPGVIAATGLGPFMYRNRAAVTSPRIQAFFKSLRDSTDLPIGAAGFCWGGKHILDLCKDTAAKPMIVAGYTAHPSAVSIPADFEDLNIPLSVCAGSEDFQTPIPALEKLKPVFARLNADAKEQKFELEVVQDAKHGFAVRGHPDREDENRYAQTAEDQAVKWFEKWMRL